MNHLLHRGKLIILTMALASGGLASSFAQVTQAATHPPVDLSAQTQPGSQYTPPDPC
jgi:hypothetical protein